MLARSIGSVRSGGSARRRRGQSASSWRSRASRLQCSVLGSDSLLTQLRWYLGLALRGCEHGLILWRHHNRPSLDPLPTCYASSLEGGGNEVLCCLGVWRAREGILPHPSAPTSSPARSAVYWWRRSSLSSTANSLSMHRGEGETRPRRGSQRARGLCGHGK